MAIKLLRRTMVDQGQDTMGDRVLSGTRVIDEAALAAMTAQQGNELAIGAIPLPHRIETRHFAMLGTTGSGKTTALRQMLDGIEARGEPALVYDTSGEFIAHYYRPERGDIILNPFDARCAFWSPFDEIAHPADADRIARQLCPTPAARTMTSGWRPAASWSPICSARSGPRAIVGSKPCWRPCKSRARTS
jgi:type IV secretory pathway TraG/TraD family ATPase VirD4